jgi:endonuclease YncB( thermonuclease family)
VHGAHMLRRRNRVARMTGAVMLAAQLAIPAAAQQATQSREQARCQLRAGPTLAVVRVVDAETVQLDDGREVRLIGALAPRSPDMSPNATPWPPEQRAEAALRDLVLGNSVELAFGEHDRDRYGRLLAHLFLNRDGERLWVQGELLRTGHARAYGLPGSFACMHELLAHERVARQAQSGLWANAAYATRPAYQARAILRQRNTYQIVSGRLVQATTTKTYTYLNFGKDWRSDFTAGIAGKLTRKHPAWAKTLAGLAGKKVEVRGWITYRNGPFIEIEDPSQIATVEEPTRPDAAAPGGPLLSSDPGPAPQKRKRPAKRKPGAVDL